MDGVTSPKFQVRFQSLKSKDYPREMHRVTFLGDSFSRIML